MYWCDNCGEFVEGVEEAIYADTANCGRPWNGGSIFYSEMRCENCGSTALTEAHRCPTCGEWTVTDYCAECEQEAEKELEEIASKHKEPQEWLCLLTEVADSLWWRIERRKTCLQQKH